MHIPATITEMIQILMQDYGFPEEVLARHFRLTAEQLEQLLSGDPDGLPGDPAERYRAQSRISRLYFGVCESREQKLSGYLEVLLSYHGLSRETVARAAQVPSEAVERALDPETLPFLDPEVRYCLAAAVMVLRFLFREDEPTL